MSILASIRWPLRKRRYEDGRSTEWECSSRGYQLNTVIPFCYILHTVSLSPFYLLNIRLFAIVSNSRDPFFQCASYAFHPSLFTAASQLDWIAFRLTLHNGTSLHPLIPCDLLYSSFLVVCLKKVIHWNSYLCANCFMDMAGITRIGTERD